ncbi:hypothetical protein ACRWGX_10645, partial [Escherichia coli]
QKQKKLIMLPSETMIWQPEFTDKTLSRKPGAVQIGIQIFSDKVLIAITTAVTLNVFAAFLGVIRGLFPSGKSSGEKE